MAGGWPRGARPSYPCLLEHGAVNMRECPKAHRPEFCAGLGCDRSERWRSGPDGLGVLVGWMSRPLLSRLRYRGSFLRRGMVPRLHPRYEAVGKFGRFQNKPWSFIVRTVLLIFGIWLLINVLFVMVVMPSRRPIPPPKRSGTTGSPTPDQQDRSSPGRG